MAGFHRKQYFIEKGYQLRYAGVILAVAIVAAVTSGVTVFCSSWYILSPKLAAVYPQGLFALTMKQVLIVSLRNIVVLSAGLFVFAILISHRVAGPVSRLKRMIRAIGDGKFTEPIYLRKTDELRDLAEELNAMRQKLKGPE